MQMSDTNQAAPKLTIQDPVDVETLQKFTELSANRAQIGERLVDLELNKIRLVRAASDIDLDRQRRFEQVLADRGLPPNAHVEIHAATGKISLLGPDGLAIPDPPAPDQA